MFRTLLAALALAGAFSSHALAGSACPQHYLGGEPPVLAMPHEGARELCASAFATLWSPVTRDPIYSVEHLTAAGLTAADRTARLDAFHADARLPPGERAEMFDYAGGAYDRGHMAPAHDMPTPEAMRESFALSNIVPQDPANNRGVWARLEEFVRRLAVLGGEAYVVTGPVFDAHPARLADRVAIPMRLYKAVYVPAGAFNAAQAGAYVVDNRADAHPAIVSLDGLRVLAGVDPFPGLPPEIKARASLPPVAAQ